MNTTVGVTIPSDPQNVLDAVRTGTIAVDDSAKGIFDRTRVFLYNVDDTTAKYRGRVVLVLSDEGKRELGRNGGAAIDGMLAQVKDPGFRQAQAFYNTGIAGSLPAPLDLARHVDHALVPEEDHPALMAALDEVARRDPSLATIAGRPYQEFFRASDDLGNALERDAFRRADPSWAPRWADRPPNAERAAVALASKAVGAMPPEIPEGVRRRIATALVVDHAVDTGPIAEDVATGKIREFHHGISIETSSHFPIPETIRSGLHADSTIAYFGSGVYYGSPSVAGGYAGRASAHGDILSGTVTLGRVSPDKHLVEGFDSALDPRKGFDIGDYWVTADPHRFRITAWTALEPEGTPALADRLPDLLEASAINPSWAKPYLDKVRSQSR